MRSFLLGLIVVASACVVASTASADIIDDQVFTVPITSDSYFIGAADLTPRATLYTNTTQTGFRYTPGGAAPVDNRRVAFDDVPIPVARLGGNVWVDLTQVSVGIRQVAGAPATTVNIYTATLTTGPTPPATELDPPGTLICTANLPAAAASVTTVVNCGNGINVFANVPLNMTLLNGFGTFAVGVKLSDTGGLNGWRLTSGPDANADVFWQFDKKATPPTAAFFFGGTPTNPAATFYISVLGNPSPEPASLALIGLGALMLLRRRR